MGVCVKAAWLEGLRPKTPIQQQSPLQQGKAEDESVKRRPAGPGGKAPDAAR
jgi:hypothetical protein